MSKDNVLKKQFNKKDVTRLRNVMSGKADQRSGEGIGYQKAQEFHQEGDVWTEHGREWTIKDGIKQNVTKLDRAKSATMPLFCPSCSKIMKHQNDAYMYKQYKRCFSCQSEFETELKIKGLWEDYQKNIVNAHIDGFIENYKEWVQDALTTSNQGFVSEAGDVEEWKGGVDTKLVAQSLEETIKYLESLKK